MCRHGSLPDVSGGAIRKEEESMKRFALTILAGLLTVATTGAPASAKQFTGTPKADTIVGTVKKDLIKARGGNDTVRARAGADTVKGGLGADTLNGGKSADVLRGGPGNDTMIGSKGKDRLVGGAGSETARGGSGSDVLKMDGDTGNDFVTCGEDEGGSDRDRARVDAEDIVDGETASTITTTSGLSCETLFVEGVQIPAVP